MFDLFSISNFKKKDYNGLQLQISSIYFSPFQGRPDSKLTILFLLPHASHHNSKVLLIIFCFREKLGHFLFLSLCAQKKRESLIILLWKGVRANYKFLRQYKLWWDLSCSCMGTLRGRSSLSKLLLYLQLPRWVRYPKENDIAY